MVAVFIYSKKYGDQGPPVSNPTSTQHFTISVPYGSEGKFNTRRSPLNRLAEMQIKFLKSNGFNFQTNNGLTGNGLVNTPLKVDTSWIEQNFVNSKYWPFSQVGDPTDSELPISGSYLSVTYPYGVDPFVSTAFVEGNGDLRVLRHVTNGEAMRVTYATWNNYRQTPISTMKIQDTVYQPPGLIEGEYIRNVFSMSSQAMCVEIWNVAGFLEYAFVNLNGTAIAEYHTIIRMGLRPLTVWGFSGGVALNMRGFRSRNLMATIVNGRRFIVAVAPSEIGRACKLYFAEVFADGTLQAVLNWNSTNHLGKQTSENTGAVLFNVGATTDPNELSRCFLIKNPNITMQHMEGSDVGSSPFSKATLTELPNGKIGLMMYHYAAVTNRNVMSRDFKAQYFYIVDIINRQVVPEPTTGFRNYTVDLNGDDFVFEGPMPYAIGHYYGRDQNFQLLPSGDRLSHLVTASAMDIVPTMGVYTGDGNTATAAMSDNNFHTTSLSKSTPLVLTAPTAILASKAATLIHNNLIQIDAPFNRNTGVASGAYGRLIGSPNAKTYNLLNNVTDSSRVSMNGYLLNNERGKLNQYNLCINAFRSKTGELHYHNAMWSKTTPQTKVFVGNINSQLTHRGKFECNPVVYVKMEQMILQRFANVMLPGGFSEVHNYDWLIIPAHPSIAKDHAFYKVWISFKVPDVSNPLGYRYSGQYLYTGLMDAVIFINGDGDCLLGDINTYMINTDITNIVSSDYIFYPGEAWLRGGSAIRYRETDVAGIILGGNTSGTHTGMGYAGWQQRGFKTNYQNTNPVTVNTLPMPTAQVSIHPTLGLGAITSTYGLGSVYTFSRLDEDNLTTINGTYLLGSARPAAGFNLTITSPFEVYSQGVIAEIPIQTVDITQVNPTSATAHLNAHLYMYIEIINSSGILKLSYTPLVEHMSQFLIGHIYTSATEITKIESAPVSRWEVARASIKPLGSSLPTATGLASSLGVDTIWDNYQLNAGDPTEFLWSEEDLYDTDGSHQTIITETYWSTKADGSDVVPNSELGDDLYYIVKTLGPANSIQLKINAPTFTGSMFEVGEVEKWINIGLTKTGNIGFGSYLIRTLDEDEMSFRNTKYQNLTPSRAFNTEYSNDTNSSIVVSIIVQILDGTTNVSTNLTVEGEVASSGFVNGNIGTRMVTTLVAVVSPGEKYKLIPGSGVTIVKWSERRPI